MVDELQKLEENRDILISAIAESMVIYGVTPSVGRIYGVLYFAKEPMTLDEIKDAVAMSKGSVSTGLRELLDTEMITKVWKKGDRKDHFIAERDFIQNFIRFFVKKIRQERNIILKAYEKVEPILTEMINETKSDQVKQEGINDLKLIQDSMKYFDWTQRLTNAMETKEIFDYIPINKEDNYKN